MGWGKPQEWRDGYPKVTPPPVKMVCGIPEARWKQLSLRERQALEAAQYDGRTLEDVLAEWDARDARLEAIRARNSAAAEGAEAGEAAAAGDDKPP